MKYLSSTLLLLIASMFIIGCDENPQYFIKKSNPLVIIDIKSYYDKFLYKASNKLNGQMILFIDTAGAYSVGDTITFKK